MNTDNINFLKKVSLISTDALIKKVAKTNKSGERNSVTVTDPSVSFIMYSSGDRVFDDTFGIKNIGSFIKNYNTFDKLKETNGSLLFSDDTKRVTFRKYLPKMVMDVSTPDVDISNYTTILLSKGDIKSINSAFKDYKDLSNYVSFIVDKTNDLTMKIGELDHENIFEMKLLKVQRSEKTEIKFTSKIINIMKLFSSLDVDRDENKVQLYISDGDTLIVIEKNDLSLTKYYVSPLVDDADGLGDL